MSKTIQQLLQSNKTIDRLDAELLIAHTLKKSREFVLSHPKTKVSKIQETKYKRFVSKRSKGIPFAYLTGNKEFFRLDFFVNKNVLIPRPDTEVLVEEAIKHINTQTHKPITLVDVGTGSGCIPISIIKTSKHPNIQTFATDISRRALRIAKRNAKKHHVKASLGSAHVAGKIKFLYGNLLSPILKSSVISPKSSVIITANLPYITKKQFENEPSIHHEPKLALIAKKQGLALYEELLEQLADLQTCRLACFFEIDPNQSMEIKTLIKKCLPNAKIEIKPDLAGLDRVVIIKNN